MNRRAWSRFVVAFATAGAIDLASEAKADAPGSQYGDFNGVDVVISDNGTKLAWQRGHGGPFDFGDAAAYCQRLALPSTSPPWRVPSYKELLTLVDEHPHVSYFTGTPENVAIDRNAFFDTPTDTFYWSSSLYAPKTGNAYTVDFTDGTVQWESTTAAGYVRCVSGP